MDEFCGGVTMIKIAICDDEKYMVDDISLRIMDYFENDNEKFELFEFDNGSDFLKFYSEDGKSDIIFMDIEIGADNGLELISKVKEIDSDVIVIFVTSHSEQVHSMFRLGAFQYMPKPIEDKLFAAEMERAVNMLAKSSQQFLFKSNNVSKALKYGQIYCYEMKKGKIVLYLKENSIFIDERKTMSKLENQVSPHDFVRVEQGFIVNMSKISEICLDYLLLDNGKKISISRGKKSGFLDAYNRYLLRSRL